MNRKLIDTCLAAGDTRLVIWGEPGEAKCVGTGEIRGEEFALAKLLIEGRETVDRVNFTDIQEVRICEY